MNVNSEYFISYFAQLRYNTFDKGYFPSKEVTSPELIRCTQTTLPDITDMPPSLHSVLPGKVYSP